MNMIIKWADAAQGRERLLFKPTTPFDNGHIERPIRVTFYNSTLNELIGLEKVAMDLLYEFASVESPNLLFLGTDPGKLPFIDIGNQPSGGYIPVTIRYSEENQIQSGILDHGQFPELAAHMVGRLEGSSSDYDQALHDLIVARAHHTVHQDILVTTSKWLLGNKEIGFIEDANPCLPSVAIKIIGLLLRTRGDFRYAGRVAFDRGLFYWVLVRHELLAMWRYFNACVYSEKLRGDDVLILGQSILVRCVRAVQARDEAMYHFDYLTLLLSGALDAQARVAYRAYQTTIPPNERNVSFRDSAFVTELGKIDPNLAGFLNGDYFKDISLIISRMRNTIHGAGLTTMAYKNHVDSEKSYVRIPDADAQTIWDISEKYGSAWGWGLLKLVGIIVFEPYAFSQKLLDHAFEIVNTIASLTQVEKLFPSGTQVPQLNNDPPVDDQVFNSKVGERLVLLA